MTNRAANVVREVAAFAFFLALSIFFTWPLAIRLSTGVADEGDPLLNAWILDWDCYAFTHAPLHLFDAPIFAPAHLPLAYSEHMAGIAILLLPFHLLGASAITLHSIAMILGFALSGYGAWVLARLVTRNNAASLMAGIFHAFVSFRISHIPHVQIIFSGWLPLILAGLIAFHRKPSRRNAALFAAAVVMNGLTNIYWLLFSSVAVVLTIWLFAIAEPRGAEYRRRLIGALVAAVLITLPFLVPYAIVSDEYKMTRMGGEAAAGSATWTDWLVPAPNNTFYASLPTAEIARVERALFPGFVPVVMLLVAIFLTPPNTAGQDARRSQPGWLRYLDALIVAMALLTYYSIVKDGLSFRKDILYTGFDVPMMLVVLLLVVRFSIAIPEALGGGNLRSRLAASRFSPYAWAAVVWMVTGFLGAFGRSGFFGEFLFRRTMAFRALRALTRFGVLTYVGLAVWMAMGIALLLSRVQRPAWRNALTALLFAATLFDVWPNLRWQYVWETPSEARLWMRDHARESGGSTLELPLDRYGSSFVYLLGSTVHHTPIMNGTSGFEPPLHQKLREAEGRYQFDDAFLDMLERNGCALVLMHVDWTGPYGPYYGKWIQRNMARGRMTFVRRFDYGALGDWLFAVTRNSKIRGVTSDPDLTRFFEGKATYNHSTFGRMEQPRDGSDVRGPLYVRAWALSPTGIRSATVLLDAGRVRIPATLEPRIDVTGAWPWYPRTPNPGITVTIPKRPLLMNRDTDVQVEVVDGTGKVTRFHDSKIVWH